MSKTYILIEESGNAIKIEAEEIENTLKERMLKGESFEIFLAEPMKLKFSLSPVNMKQEEDEEEEEEVYPVKRRRRRRKKGSRASGAKARKRNTDSGRVGRPAVNVGPCTVPGCSGKSKTKGLCSAHYQQHRRMVREGDPNGLVSKGGNGSEGDDSARKTQKQKKSSDKKQKQ